MVPGVITPPDPAADLAAQYPNLSATNAAVSGNILAGLQGNISQPDLNYMQDQAAGAAAASGMPGSNVMTGTLGGNKSARDIGKLQYQVQQDALNNYNKTIPTVSSTQTLSPQLQLEVAGTNALNASAPNPQTAQSYAQQLYDQHLAAARGPGGGTGGSGGPAGGTVTSNQNSPNYTNPSASYGTGKGVGLPGLGNSSIGGIATSGATGTSGTSGTVDANGDEWVDVGNGQMMNLTTGAMQQGNPAGGQGTMGNQPVSSGSMYMGDVSGYDASQLVDPYGMDESW